MFFNSSASTYTSPTTLPNPEVLQFHQRLPDYSITPLTPLPELAKQLGLGHVFVKDESSRLGLPAFKILGASWAIYKAIAQKCNLPLDSSLEALGLSAKQHNIKLVTCTEGNWGRATARMAKYLSIPAIVFVPSFMDSATQHKISSEGAKVVVVKGDYDDSIRAAREESERGNGLLVMDTSWPGYTEIPQWVVEGYSTLLLETDHQLAELGKEATHTIAAVGVGSWAHAVCQHYKSEASRAIVVTVEPETAASLKTSLETGGITAISTSPTIMNGMCCGTVSHTAWEVLKKGVDVAVTVTDVECHGDVRYLHAVGVKVGPCGAATLSALRKLCKEGKLGLNEDSAVVLYSTEGERDYVVPT
ncbi:tryptophan synthase beta subunit-like PLP-dependent enzyme [Delitschia confertaspora ATCC 74209]|uniref:Tryptophan synthase beta subunit-like PLP-dependent enzyme n=1 Tax=Delitschia confertaspora ATCC 74209 TaxID=1513339 RepID=A0A9P4JNW2_9PLEO|nr:tryptophan synthase beta subunit-like PLP-dependent enzyme [Delitschia confertaspora ATCC 74209]